MRLPAIALVAAALSSLAFVIAASIIGCDTSGSTAQGDFSIGAPGCRAPNACYNINCNCTRESVPGCVVCDPKAQANGTCDCALIDGGVTAMCLEAAQVCVGRAATACPGLGARCLPKGSSCSDEGGVPPQLVSAVSGDAGPSLEPRCAFADDVCCPGAEADRSIPEDAGAPPDLLDVDTL